MNLEVMWQVTFLAFLAVFIVVLVLNVYIFLDLRRKLTGGVDRVEFTPKVLNKELFDTVVSDSKKRRVVFDGVFLIKPDIKDPSTPP